MQFETKERTDFLHNVQGGGVRGAYRYVVLITVKATNDPAAKRLTQVLRGVRKRRKIQVDVSSLFFVQNIVRFASFFYVSGVALKYMEELHGPLLLILELVTNYLLDLL